MHDTCTIFGGHIVAQDNLKRAFSRIRPWDQLLVLHTLKVSTLAAPKHLWCLAELLAISGQTCLCEEVIRLFAFRLFAFRLTIWVLAFDNNVVNLWTYAQRGVAWKSPRSSGPRESVQFSAVNNATQLYTTATQSYTFHLKLRRTRCVLHIAVATRLVQLV